MKCKMVTLFRYDLEPVHLFKDVGQIPMAFAQWGFDVSIVGFWNTLPALPFVQQISRYRPQSRFLRSIWIIFYLLLNSRKIDLLNLYFWGNDTFIFGMLYKFLNPRGFLYIKSDAFPALIQSRKRSPTLERQFIRRVDLVSVETHSTIELFRKLFPALGPKLVHVPNCVDQELLSVPFEAGKKEQMIISVGTIGLPVKNHRFLVDTFLDLDLKGWKLVLLGPVDAGFMMWLRNHDKNPLETGTIELPGRVDTRAELAAWLQRASVFALTSVYESYGIALLESLCFGACAVGSDTVGSIFDLQASTGMVEIFKNSDAASLSQALTKAVTRSQTERTFFDTQALSVRGSYDWGKVLEPVRQIISKRNLSI